MTETISTLEVRRRLGDILNRVHLRRDEFIIARKGKPIAAVVPVEKLERMRRAAEGHWLRLLRRRGSALSQAEADRIANEAKHGSRRRR